MTSSSNDYRQGPWTPEEARKMTAANLGCTVEDLENATRAFKEMDEKERQNSRPVKRINKIIDAIAHEAQYAENGGWLHTIVSRLEKFRDEEL